MCVNEAAVYSDVCKAAEHQVDTMHRLMDAMYKGCPPIEEAMSLLLQGVVQTQDAILAFITTYGQKYGLPKPETLDRKYDEMMVRLINDLTIMGQMDQTDQN